MRKKGEGQIVQSNVCEVGVGEQMHIFPYRRAQIICGRIHKKLVTVSQLGDNGGKEAYFSLYKQKMSLNIF